MNEYKLVFNAALEVIPCYNFNIPFSGLPLVKTSDINQTNDHFDFLLGDKMTNMLCCVRRLELRGSVFVGDGSWATLVPVVAGALATMVNAFEHGGQVGMVFEMYKNCGGLFQMLEETIAATIEEKDMKKREDEELFEMKMDLQSGRRYPNLENLPQNLLRIILKEVR
ncbi:Petal formation-expressed [Sesbania bispinosa]|nr:Petal formation-expressed [Sesbania bispinosa]